VGKVLTGLLVPRIVQASARVLFCLRFVVEGNCLLLKLELPLPPALLFKLNLKLPLITLELVNFLVVRAPFLQDATTTTN